MRVRCAVEVVVVLFFKQLMWMRLRWGSGSGCGGFFKSWWMWVRWAVIEEAVVAYRWVRAVIVEVDVVFWGRNEGIEEMGERSKL